MTDPEFNQRVLPPGAAEAQQQVVDPEEEKRRKRQGRALVLCLDRSGSMSGQPYQALIEGSLIIGKSVYESKEFEHFIVVFYDSRAETMNVDTYEQYEPRIRNSFTGGGTNFGQAFNNIIDFLNQNSGVRDISTIFFTDGQDGGG